MRITQTKEQAIEEYNACGSGGHGIKVISFAASDFDYHAGPAGEVRQCRLASTAWPVRNEHPTSAR